MVKIPELPGGYKPGDVVNGHVLNERGSWVPVEGAGAEGAATAASAPAPGAPSSGTPYATPNPNPYLRPAPRTTASRKGGCVGGLIVALLVIAGMVGLAVLAFRWTNELDAAEPEWGIDLDDDWADIDVETPIIQLPEIPEGPSFSLSDEEAALIEATHWEVWRTDSTSYFLITVEAPGLERPRTTVSVQLTATDEDGVTHEAGDFITVLGGERTLAVGPFREQLDADVTELDVRFIPLLVADEINPYTVTASDAEIEADPRPVLTATLTAGPYGEPPDALRLAVVVRDADGEIVNLGITYPPVPGLGESTPVSLPLPSTRPLPDGATWEITLMPH